MTDSFTHLDSAGHARMVDVTAKTPTVRAATARGRVVVAAETIAALRDGAVPKGDVLAVARIAGIQGAKRCAELLPLAHVIGVHGAERRPGRHGRRPSTSPRPCAPPTARASRWRRSRPYRSQGWPIVDMVKGIDRSAMMTDMRIVAKEGGRSGSWTRPGE